MRQRWHNLRLTHAMYMALAALALANSGCLVVAAGAAAGGAAGYAYYKGKVTRAYSASFNDTSAAVHSALTELGMPVEGETPEAGSTLIHSRTADSERVRISVETTGSATLPGSPLTEVSVRVGNVGFGDEAVSERILYQVGAHLVARPAAGPPAGPPAPPALGPVQPAQAIMPASNTAEPPLAR
ncbi:MAG TPA: DUF3568 family protein [Gemmataceae bacterium]|jgi:hypothetical protein|nr:DUF3568 family protein [Gemmataceae bacterium]